MSKTINVIDILKPYFKIIKCSSADGVGMCDVHTKFSENWSNVFEVERLYVHTAWWFHNPVSHLQE
jgi:hypothetical protein